MDWKSSEELRSVLSACVLQGYQHKETLTVVQNQFGWCLRTLKRRLRFFKIKKNDVDLHNPAVLSAIRAELLGPAKLLGYRALHQHIRLKYGLKVKRKDVYTAMRMFAPEGLMARRIIRRRKKFHRRQFISKGPNWMWSVDGHDKLMGLYKHEFPLAIHGCIDSFSRKIIWLRAWPGNSSTQLPARLYYEAVRLLEVTLGFVRTDCGNENGTLRLMHNFLRESTDGLAHIYGSSMTNQVIERFWRDFRERQGDFFRSFVRKLVSTGLYSDKDNNARTLLAVLLIPILQDELNRFKAYWNTHRIRTQKIRRPCGIPNYMFAHPEDFGFHQCGIPLQLHRLEFVKLKLNYGNDMEFVSSETYDALKEILLKCNFFPVTIVNMIEAYTILYLGCKKNGVALPVL